MSNLKTPKSKGGERYSDAGRQGTACTPSKQLFYCIVSNGKAYDNEEHEDSWLKNYDEKLLHWTLRHPYKVIVGAALLFAAAMATLPLVGTAFLPDFNEGTLTINVQAQPGTSLAESSRIGQISEKLLLEVPEVISTGRRTGRAELDEHAEGVHYTEIDVDLKASESQWEQARTWRWNPPTSRS